MANNDELYDPIEESELQESEPQSQSQLIWRQFKRHKLAVTGLIILIVFYLATVFFTEFFAPYSQFERFGETYMPPQRIRFIDAEGNFHLRPFVYNRESELDRETWQTVYTVDTSQRYPIRFFVRGSEYRLLGLVETDLRFFGVDEGGQLHLFGTDQLSRDVFSRVIYACRISLTIGFAGVFMSLILGLIFGGISGFFGGTIDDIIQRIIEVLMSIPAIPLWMALAAAIPDDWSPLQVYFAITIILSLIGWTGLARVVRSKFISLREEDFIIAAQSYNESTPTLIFQYMIPNFLSYIIVNLTLAIPTMIIAETSLSFLGIGLRPPVVSLGVLLEQAQSFQTVSMHPWLMIPGLFVVLVVLCYNFVGDGIRDAADPYD